MVVVHYVITFFATNLHQSAPNLTFNMDIAGIMSFLLKMFGITPTPTADGAFTPSKFAIKMMTSAKTDFDGGAYNSPYNGRKQLRILMVCTQEGNMIMTNGKKFSTGNHPVEVGLPMLHLRNAGFQIDVVSPTGAPVIFEEWAMPGRHYYRHNEL